MKVEELLQLRKYHPSLLIYGGLGTGKTAFMGQMGERGQLLDFDQGYKTLAKFDDKWKPDRLKTEIESFFDDNWEVPTAYRKARSFIQKLRIKMSKPENKIKVVGLDSFTGLYKSVIASVTAASGHAGRMPTQPEWGVILNEIENFMRLFKGLPAPKLVAGHTFLRVLDDETTTIKLLCPGVKLPDQVAGFFDDVFYAKVMKRPQGKYDFILTSKPTNAVECRTRTSFHDDFAMNDGLWDFLRKLEYIEPGKDGD